MTMEAETEGRGHKPRDAWSPQKGEAGRTPPEPPGAPCRPLDFRLLAPRLGGNKPPACGQPQKIRKIIFVFWFQIFQGNHPGRHEIQTRP